MTAYQKFRAGHWWDRCAELQGMQLRGGLAFPAAPVQVYPVAPRPSATTVRMKVRDSGWQGGLDLNQPVNGVNDALQALGLKAGDEVEVTLRAAPARSRPIHFTFS